MPIELQRARPRAATHKKTGEGLRKRLEAGGPVTAQERSFFTERLALLLDTGNPLYSSLDLLESQTSRDPVHEMIKGLRHDISQGSSFSQALARHPEIFPRTYVNLVAAGENGGFLPEVLERLREMDEKRRELNSTLVAALSYPAFLLFFTGGVVVFVLMVVFPKFSDLFADIADELPAVTVFLMALSDGLRQYWAPGLAAIGATSALFWTWARGESGSITLDRLALRVPVLREIIVQLNVVQFMRVMSLSLANGVAMLDALRSCREIAKSAVFRRFVGDLEAGVTEGAGIASGFEKAAFLPPLVQRMIATGEESGHLAMVMGRVADFYEREWRKRLTVLSKIAEPVMLLVMGTFVGLIVSSLILPIFKLSRAVH